MRDGIGFIAIGQAGGNIGQLFEEKGFPVLYTNTAELDLNTLKSVKYKYHITDGEGCNKDRNKAKELIISDYDNLASKIDTIFNNDFIFVIFAAGGGTGSGSGPMMCDLMLDGTERHVGAITILPSKNESIKSQINTYECFKELMDIDSLGSCFILDNERADRADINKRFVDAFAEFVQIPEHYHSVNGNIDNAEIVETLNTKGMSIVNLDCKTDISQIIAEIDDNIYAPMEKDERIKYITASCDDTVPDFTEIQNVTGVPYDSFRTYSDKAIVALSGLTYPMARLEEIHDMILDHKEMIVTNISETPTVKLSDDIDFVNAATPKKAGAMQNNNPKSRRDMISKYLHK